MMARSKAWASARSAAGPRRALLQGDVDAEGDLDGVLTFVQDWIGESELDVMALRRMSRRSIRTWTA